MKKIILFLALFIITSIQSQALLVKDIETGALSSMPTYNFNRENINNNLLFTVYNSATDDYHLWKTDGTESGTELLKTLVDYTNYPAQYLTYSSSLNKVFFGGIDSCLGTLSSLWSTDGTTQNTAKVNGYNATVKYITNLNGGVIFRAKTSNNTGEELVFFNGTALTTIDVNAGAAHSFPSELKAIGNKVYFSARANTNEGNEICVTDGTAAGTYRIKDINPSGSGIINSDPKDYFGFNNKVYFTADNGTNGRELWVTDGTETNTTMVADMNPGNNPSFYADPNFTIYKDELYFTGFTPATGVELFKINTTGNISNVADINPGGGTNHSYPKDFFVFDGKLFFSADNGTDGYELWYTQNTGGSTSKTAAVTTAIFKNINATGDSNPTNFIEFNGKMYFNANDGVNGKELWESDGTVAGTILKQDINPSRGSNPRDFIISNNLLYFSADDGINGDELWKFSNNPIVGSFDPNDDKIDVALDSRLKITFNKTIQKNTGNIIIYDASDDSVFETISITSGNISITGNELLIEPSTDFGLAKKYYVQIDNTAIKDADNNFFAGISDKTTWNFETIDKQNQTITFNTLANKTFGDANFNLTATSSSNLAVSYTSSNTNVATINGNTVTIIGAGTTTITASQTGDANYNAATDVSQSLTVEKSTQGILFSPFPNKYFGDPDFQLTAFSGSGLPVSYASSNTNAVVINGNIVSMIAAGTSIITASQSGNANYHPASNRTQILSVSKASQTITFNNLANKNFGNADFNLGASSTSNLAISYTSSNTNVATINENTVTIVGVGNTTITASQPGNTNYAAAASISQTLTINKGVRVVTLNPIPAKKFGDPNFFITTSVVGGVPANNQIFYYLNSTNAATLNVNTGEVAITGTGTVVFSIEYRVNANYVRTDVNGSFTINKADQTITFNPIATVGVDDANFNLAATSNSGLPISYVSSNPSVASINGNVVDVLTVGSTTITASQIGNNNYNAATDVSQTLTVSNTANVDDFSKLNFEIYPNPASSIFTMKSEIKIEKIEIYNVIAQKVKEFIKPKSNEFSIKELKNGIYLLKIHTEKGIATSKILKSDK